MSKWNKMFLENSFLSVGFAFLTVGMMFFIISFKVPIFSVLWCLLLGISIISNCKAVMIFMEYTEKRGGLLRSKYIGRIKKFSSSFKYWKRY
ncbi:hypothetical protein IEQ_04906 [Bacillus cereus BAG6X1-2]|nr:hypothetical protein IEQ_04906 [Bacillus cereus BAG6X1-2]